MGTLASPLRIDKYFIPILVEVPTCQFDSTGRIKELRRLAFFVLI